MTTATTSAAVAVGTLSDAELAVLAGPRTRVGHRPVMPVWSLLDDGRRRAAARDACASLAVRRLVDPDSGSVVRRDLRSVLVLREAAAVVVVVSRVSPHGRDHWYAHLVGDVVLLEQVSVDGVHRFALAAAATLPELVAAAVLHPDAGTATAASADDQTDWLRADVELRGATTRGLTWVSGPGGTWSGDRPVAPADVIGLLRDALTETAKPFETVAARPPQEPDVR